MTKSLSDKVQQINPEAFEELITKTSREHPYLAREAKKPVLAILASLKKSPFFLPERPTPIGSSLQFLQSILDIEVSRLDLVFVLVAIGAPLGVKSTKLRKTFKIFPKGVPSDPKEAAGFEPYYIKTKRTAEQVEYTITDVVQPTKQESANIGSCTNKLIKQYELKLKALELYRRNQEGDSFAQAKKDMGMGDREYVSAYQLLARLGLVRPKKVPRKRIDLSADNMNFVQQQADARELDLSAVVNELLDAARTQAEATAT